MLKPSPLKHREGHSMLTEEAHQEAHGGTITEDAVEGTGVKTTSAFTSGDAVFNLDDQNQIWTDGEGNVVDDKDVPKEHIDANKKKLQNSVQGGGKEDKVSENSAIQNAEAFKATEEQTKSAIESANSNTDLAVKQREEFRILKNKEQGLDANGKQLMLNGRPYIPSSGPPNKPMAGNPNADARYKQQMKDYEKAQEDKKALKLARDTNPMWSYLKKAEEAMRWVEDENGKKIKNPNFKEDATDENIIAEAKKAYLIDQEDKHLQKNVEAWIDKQDGVGVSMPEAQKDEIAKNEAEITKLDAKQKINIQSVSTYSNLYSDINTQMGELKAGFEDKDDIYKGKFDDVKKRLAELGPVDENSSAALIAKYNAINEEGRGVNEEYATYAKSKTNFIAKFDELEKSRNSYKKHYLNAAKETQEFSENGEDLMAYHNLMNRNGHFLTGIGATIAAATVELASGVESLAAEVVMLPQGLRNDKMLGDNALAQFMVAKADQFETARGGKPILDAKGNWTGNNEKGYKESINKVAESLHNGVQLPQAYDDIETVGDFGAYGANVLANFVPQAVAMSVMGPASLYMMGASAAGGDMAMSRRSNQLGETNYSLGQRIVHGLAAGGAEIVTERYTFNLIKGAKQVTKRRISDGFGQAIKKTFDFKNLGKAGSNMIGEGTSEVNATIFGQNAGDILLYGKNKSLFEGIDESFVSGALMERGIAMPGLASRLSQPFRGNRFDSKIQSFEKAKRSLEKEISNPNASEEVKKGLRDKYLDIQAKEDVLLKESHKNVDMMSEKEVSDLIALDVKLNNIKQHEDNINDNNSYTPAEKEKLIKDNRKDEESVLAERNTIVQKHEDPATKDKREEEYEAQKKLVQAKTTAYNKQQAKKDKENNSSKRGEVVEFETKEEQRQFFESNFKEGREQLQTEIKELKELIADPKTSRADKAGLKQALKFRKAEIKKNDISNKQNSGQYGFIDQKQDGSFKIYLNKENSLKTGGNINVAAHEFLHSTLYQTIGNDSDVQAKLGGAVIEYVNKIKGGFSQKFIDKMKPYQGDSNFGEEVITVMSESILDGSLKFNDGFFTKVGDVIRQQLQKLGLKKIKFDTGKDVYNFVKDYNASIEKNYNSKAIDRMMDSGARGQLTEGKKSDKAAQQASMSTPLEAINELIPKNIKTKREYDAFVQDRRAFPAVFNATMGNGVISNYVKSKSIGGEYQGAIESVQNRLTNFNPEATRADGSVVGPEGFGEFIFANTRFGKLDSKKKLFKAGEKTKREESIDSVEARQVEDTSTATSVEDNSKARTLRDFDIEVEDGLVNAEIEAEVEALLEKNPDDVEVQMEKLILGDIRKSLDGVIGKISKDKKTGERGPTAEYEAFIRNEYTEVVQSLGMATIRSAYKPWFKQEVTGKKDYSGVSKKTGEKTNYVKPTQVNTTNKREYIRWFLEGKPGSLTERRTALIRRIARRKAKIVTDNYIEANSVNLDKVALAKLRKVSRAIEDTGAEQKSFDSLKFSKNKMLPTRLSQEFSAIFYRGNNGKPLAKKGTIWTGYVNPYTKEPQSFVDKGRIWEQAFANYFMKNGIEGLKVLSEIASEVDGMADFVFEYNGKVENHELKASITAFMGSISISNLKNGRIEFATDTHNNLLEQVDTKKFMEGYEKRVDFVNKGIEKLNKKIKDPSKRYAPIDYDVISGKPQNIPYELYMDKKGFGNKMFYQLKADQAVIENHYKSKKDKNGIGVRSLSFVGTKTGNMSFGLDSESILNLPRLDADVDVNFTFRNGGSKIVNGNKVISLSLGVQFKISSLNNVKSEKLARGLGPLLKRGSTATKKMGEDALLKLSDDFASLNNEQADEISGFLDMAIENMQDGYAKDATENLKQFNKASKDALSKKAKNLDITIKEDLQKALGISFSKSIEGRKINKAISFSRLANNPTEGITVLDFDDTLATSKSLIRFTKPDGTTGTLNAEQYASTYEHLTELGYKWDFSEFNKVVGGKIAPLFQKALKLQGKFGPKNMFVLTARPPQAAKAIFDFLKANGLNIPIKNITGLGNSTAEAKANWIAEKVGDGYNDFYFADDALQNVKAVKDMLAQFDVKSKVQQAKLQFSKSLSPKMNDILESTTGIKSEKVFSEAQAKIRGAKTEYKSIIPASAQDFKGLLYNFIGKGKKGEADLAFFQKALIDPFARGISELNTSRQNSANDYKNLQKAFPEVKKTMTDKVGDTEFNNDQATRVYLWNKAGFEVPGLSKRDLKTLIEHVQANPSLQAFAEGISLISKKENGYSKPGDFWLAENITSDLLSDGSIGDARADVMAEWQANVDVMFSPENLNKIEAIYGSNFREALEDSLYRMRTGKNRPAGGGRIMNTYMNWVNNSVGAIMFFNMRSAILQTISATNYINWSFNNPAKAALAFANQPQYWKDFSMLFNSPYLKQRRSGNQRGINEAELSAAVAGAENKAKAAIAWLLKKGFLPTQLADSFAIASGGATFFRNKVKALVKEGMTQEQAEKQAFLAFQETTEVSQQSARPDMISQQQASPLGRLILSFQNTPMQYARIMNKAARDLANGRGDTKTHLSKIAYYGVAQSILFGALQSALMASMGDDEEDDFDKKKERILNGMIDSVLSGIGYGGKAVSTIKNSIREYIKQKDKGWNADHTYTILSLLSFSPPIGSKLRKIYGSIQTEQFNQGVFKKRGLTLDNPAWSGVGNVVEGVTNVPLGRIAQKMLNIDNAMDDNNSFFERAALLLGWNTWDLGIKDKDIEAVKDEIKEEKKVETKKKQKIKKQEKKKEKEEANVAVIEENKKKSKKDGICSAISKGGNRCKTKVVEGDSFCTVHEKATPNSTGIKSQCKKVKDGNKRCKMQTSSKSGFCYYHD